MSGHRRSPWHADPAVRFTRISTPPRHWSRIGEVTELETLPTTSSGHIKKATAMAWLENLNRPSDGELRRATVEKPADFTGSTFAADVSTIRLTGDPQFIETIAGLFSWIVGMEDYSRRVEINLKAVDDKESGTKTGNYALYLSLTERG